MLLFLLWGKKKVNKEAERATPEKYISFPPTFEIPQYVFHHYNPLSHKRGCAVYIFHQVLRNFLVSLLYFVGGNAMETGYFKLLDAFEEILNLKLSLNNCTMQIILI